MSLNCTDIVVAVQALNIIRSKKTTRTIKLDIYLFFQGSNNILKDLVEVLHNHE